MAISGLQHPSQIYKFPQGKYVDAVRWLPLLSAFHRFAVVASFDCESDSSSVEVHSLNPDPPELAPHCSWISPSRVSCMKTSQLHQNSLGAASTFAGSLHFLVVDPMDASFTSVHSVDEKELHVGAISCIDLIDGGEECVSVGEDGRVNLVSAANSRLNCRRIFDSNGLVSFTAAKWASPAEFVTGGYGFSLQWWDQRKPGGAVSQFKGNWNQAASSGVVHSIDINASRKHTCVAGGSLGTVFAWDLRWQQQPIILSGAGFSDGMTGAPCESEVWEVQYDCLINPTNMGGASSAHILPAIICSEDGILAAVKQGEEPLELLAEPCAINSFDIDRKHPTFRMGINCSGEEVVLASKYCIGAKNHASNSGLWPIERSSMQFAAEAAESGLKSIFLLWFTDLDIFKERTTVRLTCCVDGITSITGSFCDPQN